ncbi:uncharacterized protein G2W53_014417 [Senna tora]|uniref:Uncharacterized protein n=1 Tax=Senna tora TaxID=362788 RepID=A0A834WTP6_9FABA|nr:uncharacterized protein G2W53_014417 [Senna tora]
MRQRLVAQLSQTRRFALYLRTGVVLMLQLESSSNGSNVDHVITYSGRKIAVESQKPSRIMRQKTCCAGDSNTFVCVVFPNHGGFDAPIGVVLAWQERGSCLNIFYMKNCGRISKTFTNYEAKDLLRRHGRSVDHVLTYSGGQIAVVSKKPSRITRQKTCCVSESNTSVRVVFANRSGFDAPIGVVLAWEERGSCTNIFRITNCGRISETFTNYEAKDLLRDKSRSDLINLHEFRGKRRVAQVTCCASESNTSVRVVFANRSGFDAPIGVIFAWEERGSCLNIFRIRNRIESQKPSRIMRQKTRCANLRNLHELRGKRLVAQVSETRRFALYSQTGVDLMLQLESSWHGRGVDHVLTYSGRKIAVGSQKPSRITRQKTCCATESNTSVRVVFANRSGFDAPIGVVLAWDKRGSCLNIFRMKNHGLILETFTNYEAKDLLHNESNTSVRVVFANRSGFDAPIGVVLAWEERGSCLNIFLITNRSQISETFSNYEAKDVAQSNLRNLLELRGKRLVVQVSQTRWFALYLRTGVVLMLLLESSWHGRSVDHDLAYSGLQIAVESQKPSRITRQKTCCRSESNTSVRVVFANRRGFDAPIGVVLAWEKRGSCLNIFRMTNHGIILENFTNYEAKYLLRK